MNWKQIIIEAFAFSALFAVLHFAYDLAPSFLTAAFSGTNESFFQHQKISFFAYAILVGLIYFLRRRQTGQNYWPARLLGTVFMPWSMFFTWYIVPTIIGHNLPDNRLEIAYSVLITLVMGGITGMLVEEFEKIRFSRSVRWMILAIFFITAVLFVSFTFHIPWDKYFYA